MFYVYLIESLSVPGQRYVGFTTNLRQRFDDHNAGKSPHTAKFKPWRLVTYIASQIEPGLRILNDISNQDPVMLSRTSDCDKDSQLSIRPVDYAPSALKRCVGAGGDRKYPDIIEVIGNILEKP